MFPTKIRAALWRANQQRCFYCSEPISFRDLEIDHLVPRKITKQEFQELSQRIALQADFDLDGLYNLVPTHHSCNGRKAADLFTAKAILFYLELWAKKQEAVHQGLRAFEKIAEHEQHLLAISKFIESGEMTKEEILHFIVRVTPSDKQKPQDPLVVTFGLNVTDLLDAGKIPKQAGETYVAICDWLEKDLLYRLLGALPVLFKETEASERNGETLSVRIAFWNLDLDRLDNFDLGNWEVLEIVPFSELYGTPPEELLKKAVVKASSDIVSDPWDTVFGIGRCPRCGSTDLKRFSQTDHHYDDTYHIIECKKCGWSEWTQ